MSRMESQRKQMLMGKFPVERKVKSFGLDFEQLRRW